MEEKDKNLIDVVAGIATDKIEKEQIIAQYKEALAMLGYSGKIVRIPSLKSSDSKTHKAKVKRLKKLMREILNESFSEIDPRKLTGNYMSIYNVLWEKKDRFEKRAKMKINGEEYDVIVLSVILDIAKKNMEKIKKIRRAEKKGK